MDWIFNLYVGSIKTIVSVDAIYIHVNVVTYESKTTRFPFRGVVASWHRQGTAGEPWPIHSLSHRPPPQNGGKSGGFYQWPFQEPKSEVPYM